MQATLNFGLHKGIPIEEFPMDYLVWIFPKLKLTRGTRKVYKLMLSYFLTKKIRIEEHNDKTVIYHFYLIDYPSLDIDGSEMPFMKSASKMENSNGESVYDIGNKLCPIFIEERDGLLNISNKYIGHTYKFGGLAMVFENNPDYYFLDGIGKVFKHAFLMRKPWIPDEAFMAGNFSENLLIKNLNETNK